MDVACIGAGVMASRLLSAIDEIDSCTLVAVCDIDEENARKEAISRDAAVYSDHEQMLEELELDALFLSIPSFAHSDQAILAAQDDIDLFVEKPVARTQKKANEIRSVIEANNILSQTGYLFRYSDITERALELMGDRTIGLIEGRYWGGIPGRSWGREKEKSGGGNVQLATHVFDIIRYFGGEVQSITTYGNRRVRDEIDFEDVNTSSMEHTNGIISHVSTNCITPEGTEVTIVGDGFILHLDYSAQTLTGSVDDKEIEFEGRNRVVRKEVESFIQAVESRDESIIRTDYADGAKTLELTLAANKSLATDSSVVLTEQSP